MSQRYDHWKFSTHNGKLKIQCEHMDKPCCVSLRSIRLVYVQQVIGGEALIIDHSPSRLKKANVRCIYKSNEDANNALTDLHFVLRAAGVIFPVAQGNDRRILKCEEKP